MIKFIHFLVILCSVGLFLKEGYSQPNVDICLYVTNNQLEVRIRPDATFQGLVSNLQFTIGWQGAGINMGNLEQTTSELLSIPIQVAGQQTVVGDTTYQKFVGFGLSTLQNLGITWLAGEEVSVVRLPASPITVQNFFIANSGWAKENNGDFYAELNGLDKTGEICHEHALPVKYLLFDAQWKKSDVYLTWVAITESQHTYFLIERSTDTEDFEEIGRVKTKGVEEELNYSFLDRKAFDASATRYYYRLKTIDIDGNFEYSPLVQIENLREEETLVYPNPSTGKINLQLPWSYESVRISIRDLHGKILFSKAFASQENTALDIAFYPSGIYIIEILDGERVWKKRLMKIQ